jgi:hypothetical protein
MANTPTPKAPPHPAAGQRLYLPPLPALPALTPAQVDALSLGEKQRRFVLMTAHLIAFAYANGYELTEGDGYRDPRVFGALGVRQGYGESSSLHKLRLAHDWNLFKDGKFQETTEAHRPLGEAWEAMGGTWGGRFNDGNHYSLAHNGLK